MFAGKSYIIPSGVPGQIVQRTDGFRDRLDNTGVVGARVILMVAGSPNPTNAIVTDPAGLKQAQALVAKIWPRTEIDIVDGAVYNLARCVVGGFAVSDYWIALGAGEASKKALFHPVGILLAAREFGYDNTKIKEYFEAEIQKIEPGFLAQLTENE